MFIKIISDRQVGLRLLFYFCFIFTTSRNVSGKNVEINKKKYFTVCKFWNTVNQF